MAPKTIDPNPHNVDPGPIRFDVDPGQSPFEALLIKLVDLSEFRGEYARAYSFSIALSHYQCRNNILFAKSFCSILYELEMQKRSSVSLWRDQQSISVQLIAVLLNEFRP